MVMKKSIKKGMKITKQNQHDIKTMKRKAHIKTV